MMNTRVEMNDKMMEQVNGGRIICKDSELVQKLLDEHYHFGCGGHIEGAVWHLTRYECDTCHEKHWFLKDFYDIDGFTFTF